MQKILERERARADRSGQEFSFVVFEIGETDLNDDHLSDLISILADRLRSTDEVGWFNKSQIGLVLPYTPVVGARKFANEICRVFSKISSPPTFTIYLYPSLWISNPLAKQV